VLVLYQNNQARITRYSLTDSSSTVTENHERAAWGYGARIFQKFAQGHSTFAVLGKIIFEMISNQNQNHESLIDLKSRAKSNHKK